ncbi:MAG TPA: SRPBCC domain-containing protein [Gemmatimonadales bacterium]|nr:SRPBCC domain-containing protein [Gemmatimonadales bacterium]
MSLMDKAAAPHTESIAFDLGLDHPPEKVWRALTDPALLTEWLLPVVDFGLEPGTSFMFSAPPQPGWDGTVNCRLLEIEPHRRLSWSWVVGDIDTVVTFTLTPSGSGTRLVVVQSGFKPHQKRNVAGARYGWKMMAGKLVELLGRP